MQPAGGPGDGILEREAGELRKKANQQSGLHEAGLLERMRRQSLMQLLFLLLLRCQVMLERLGSPRALASPGARGGSAPLPDTLDVGGACAVSAVAWLAGITAVVALGILSQDATIGMGLGVIGVSGMVAVVSYFILRDS